LSAVAAAIPLVLLSLFVLGVACRHKPGFRVLERAHGCCGW
jgi:hypothetical protein